MTDVIEKLVNLFRLFPGIGPRQAKRFVYFLLQKDSTYIKELTETLSLLRARVRTCSSCYRFFHTQGDATQCDLCSSPRRERTLLMVVERDTDLEAVEKSNVYNGLYFVLGGTVQILDKEPQKSIRSKELLTLLKTRKPSEVIIATSASPQGDETLRYIQSIFEPLGLNVTHLGRGISTGTELEYIDRDTMKSALENRG